ncbi:(R)-stereoselective amidase [Variovorax sp. PBS-H4]|uniref:nitrilase-related carbon-nitrogen hydrolase n=1 Tax=Variovorax sp. PBS-H4 TaxID=434008 RepID=UPI0013187739|nr:nitrilase-related carbon-nitrogen hydrolase [Variovorax sp. PBS-H4]VTU22340.1 (R)-stereoselective amidase [Variovorax sp. PBS-H4]
MARVALAQLEPGPDLDANLAEVARLARKAADQGASWILLPEYATFLHGSRTEMRHAAERAESVLDAIRALAARHSIWVLLGSMVVPNGDKMSNRSLLLDSNGDIAASYDKLHMFDVELAGGRRILESSAYAPGNEAVVVATPFGKVGLSICYDLRFPGLYRRLAQAGAEVIVVPSAFATATGPAHWRPLLTARAIENTAFVLAPATCGSSPGGRSTHGRTLALDPWGNAMGELETEPSALLFVDLDLGLVEEVRRQIPSLRADRAFNVREISPSSQTTKAPPMSSSSEVPMPDVAEQAPALRSHYLDVPQMPWQPTQFDGIEMKMLYSDKVTGMSTILFKMAPGAVVPLHEHTAIEQTYVLEGQLVDAEGSAGPGEFVWRPGGNIHVAHAPEGAVFLSVFMKPNRFAAGTKFFTE